MEYTIQDAIDEANELTGSNRESSNTADVVSLLATLKVGAALRDALDRNTTALETINETLNLIREDRLQEGT